MDVTISRWNRLLSNPHQKYVWKAINWKGDIYSTPVAKENTPQHKQFKTHFESLLYSDNGADVCSVNTDTAPYIMLLDDQISSKELENGINSLNSNKACDIQGNSTGLLTVLNATFFMFLFNTFNTIFMNSYYPLAWAYSNLLTIFKKGSKNLCCNYCGITINEISYRLFDGILYKQLSL